jgi:hypothetical protein
MSKTLLARRLFLPVGRGKKRKLGYQKVSKPLLDTPNPYFTYTLARNQRFWTKFIQYDILILQLIAVKIRLSEGGALMAPAEKTLKICPEGHRFYKSSSCPTCAANRKPASGFLSKLSRPARSALEAEGTTTLTELAKCSEREILRLHGMGPRSMPILRQALVDAGLSFEDGQEE